MVEGDFSNDEIAEDVEGMESMSFQRVKIPAGGTLQYEIPTEDPDNPDYAKTLTGVILYNHSAYTLWPEGNEYDEDTKPLCSSVDGKTGIGEPGGACATCPMNAYGSATDGGRGKACKNMRQLYLLRSGEYMPLSISLPPTSLKPFKEFLNRAFVLRRRATYGSIVQLGLKKENKLYHTSRVTSIYEQSDDLVHFETLNSNYYLTTSPFPLAAISPLPVSLAACA